MEQTKVKIKDNRVIIYFKNKTYSTGFTLNQKKDNVDKQFRNGRLTSHWGNDYAEVNQIIAEKKQLIDSLIIDANREGVNPINFIALNLNNKNKKVEDELNLHKMKVSDFFMKFIEWKTEQLRMSPKKSMLRKYNEQYERLQRFEKTKEGKVSILNLNKKWKNDFFEFLAKKNEDVVVAKNKGVEFETKKMYGLTNGTLYQVQMDLNSFFAFCEKVLKIQIQDSAKEVIKIQRKNVEENIITPTNEQWNDFKEFVAKAEFTPSEQKCIDLFILSSYTGMRYSDCRTLTPDHIINKNDRLVISKKAKKTKTKFEVDVDKSINPIAYEILKKYDFDIDKLGFPAHHFYISFNLNKIWQQIPSWTTTMKIHTHVLDKVIESEVPFWKVMRFHSARKIFTTNLMNQNFKPTDIMRMLGWTNLSMLNVYNNKFGDFEHKSINF